MGKQINTKKAQIKKLRKEVQEKLAVVLADYKNILPKKRYSKTLKKASKLFVSNFERTADKTKTKEKKVAIKKISEPVSEAVPLN
jgi:hypothetical protein